MIHFVIYEDILLYKIKIENVINKFKKYKYDISYNNYDKSNTLDIFIFIINLNLDKSIDLLRKISSLNNNNYYIICISTFSELQIKIFKERLLLFDFISKITSNFDDKLYKDIKLIINRSKTKHNEYRQFDKNILIPKNEIKQIIMFKDKTIINCANDKKNTYSYIVDSNNKYLKNEVAHLFNSKTIDSIFYFKNNMFNMNINYKKQSIHVKPYDNIIKEKILKLYNSGKSVSYLSNNYNISKSTIYNWIKEKNVLSTIEKYNKIERIVNNDN